jgi:metal-responsive CopG/Arc/MetJ family transcriptional regulator
MTASSSDNMKTPKKRPSITGELIGVRLQPNPLAKLDTWRRQQDDIPNRPEAIRRLVERALEEPAKVRKP